MTPAQEYKEMMRKLSELRNRIGALEGLAFRNLKAAQDQCKHKWKRHYLVDECELCGKMEGM